MGDQRRFRWRSGRLASTPINDGWALDLDSRDPSIPNLPLETPAKFVLAASSNIAASGAATTQQLTAGSGTFTAGRIQDDENPTDAVDIVADGYTELEWCIEATADTVAAEDYEFRVVLADGTPLDTYTNTPAWEIGTAGGAYTLTCESGSYALTGQAVALRAARRLTLEQGSYALNGQAVGIKRGLRLAMEQGSYALTGQAATLRAARRLTFAAGAYALTGQSAGLLRGLRLAMGQGSYTLTGQDVTLTKGAGARVLTADQGSYALTGQDAALRAARTLTLAQGSYSLNGQAAGLRRGYMLAAAQGSYALTGQAVALRAARRLALAQGAYALSGQDATLTYSSGPRVLVMAQGSYALTGQDAGLSWSGEGAAGAGGYQITRWRRRGRR